MARKFQQKIRSKQQSAIQETLTLVYIFTGIIHVNDLKFCQLIGLEI